MYQYRLAQLVWKDYSVFSQGKTIIGWIFAPYARIGPECQNTPPPWCFLTTREGVGLENRTTINRYIVCVQRRTNFIIR